MSSAMICSCSSEIFHQFSRSHFSRFSFAEMPTSLLSGRFKACSSASAVSIATNADAIRSLCILPWPSKVRKVPSALAMRTGLPWSSSMMTSVTFCFVPAY